MRGLKRVAVGILTAAVATAAAILSRFHHVKVEAPPGEALTIAPGSFPHDALDRVQKRFVNKVGQVDYAALAKDRSELERYLVALSETSPHKHPDHFDETQALTYWINAYNASVLYAVTERPTLRSVGDSKVGFFIFARYNFGGEKMSLYHLENSVIRKEFKEPRIHFALNCASVGCPQLPDEAFLPELLEEQLARESAAFCARADNVREEGDTVWLSSIFDWYAEDFSEGALAFCRANGREDLNANAQVKFIDYDWSLNAQPGRALYDTLN